MTTHATISDSSSRPPTRTFDVLVIDDEEDARTQVELALLESKIAQVTATASNGSRGAELAEQLQPDAIVLDLAMPIMDGFEALPLLRQLCPKASVLVRSSNDSPEDRERAMALGAKGFIPKFTTLEDLRSVIELVLQTTEDSHRIVREAVARIEAAQARRRAGARS